MHGDDDDDNIYLYMSDARHQKKRHVIDKSSHFFFAHNYSSFYTVDTEERFHNRIFVRHSIKLCLNSYTGCPKNHLTKRKLHISAISHSN